MKWCNFETIPSVSELWWWWWCVWSEDVQMISVNACICTHTYMCIQICQVWFLMSLYLSCLFLYIIRSLKLGTLPAQRLEFGCGWKRPWERERENFKLTFTSHLRRKQTLNFAFENMQETKFWLILTKIYTFAFWTL